ncbi:MAG: lipopolysaccharide biosynthesis protein [Planctomycetaceae bacterium]
MNLQSGEHNPPLDARLFPRGLMRPDKLLRRMGATSRRLFVDGMIALASRMLGLISAFALNSIVAYHVPAADFGIFLLVIGFVVIGELLFGWGISDYAVIQVPIYENREQPDKIRNLMGTTLLLVACSAAISLAALNMPGMPAALVMLSGEPRFPVVLNAMFVLLICWGCNGIAGRWVLSLGSGWLFQLSYFAIPRLTALVLIGTQLFRGEQIDIVSVIYAMALGCVIGAAMCGSVALRRAGWPRWNDPEPISAVLSRSGSLMFTRLLHIATPWVTLWLLSSMTSTEEMAKFGAAHRLLIAVTTAFASMLVIFKPRLSALYDTNRLAELSTICRTLSTLRMLPNALLVIIAALAGSSVMRLVYGSHYADAGIYFLCLSVGYLVWVIGGPAIEVLTITGHERRVIRLQSILITTLLVAEYAVLSLGAGIGISGPLAVAVCLAVYYTVSCCVFVTLCRKLTGVETLCTLSPRTMRAAFQID